MELSGNAPAAGGDVFVAPLLNRFVECISIDDAIAVGTVDRLLSDSHDRHLSPFELGRLAAVLKRYECLDVAKTIEQRAAQQRAAQLLKKTVGYERPEH